MTITDISVDTTQVDVHGSVNDNISDAWIYLNGNLQGIYELPATVPILASGRNNVQVFGGIKVTGRSLFRERYPFYLSDETVIDFKPNEDAFFNPKVKYADEAQFVLLDDFENLNPQLVLFDGSGDITISANEAFEGSSMMLELIEDNDRVRLASRDSFAVPNRSQDFYMEVDYKCDTTVAFYLTSVNTGTGQDLKTFTYNFRSRDEWNKAYIQITEDGQKMFSDGGRFYKLVVDVFGNKGDRVYLDNVKLVRFE